jgi:hypothetical protein
MIDVRIPPTADIKDHERQVRFVPITGREQSQQKLPLLNHLVGSGQQFVGDCETECLGRL